MTSSNERVPVLRFGVFEVDWRSRELRRQGVRVRLQGQPFQVLALLLERGGDVVTRDELRQRLWPSSVYVDFDHGLNAAMARVREALGDTAASPRFIETLPRLGYRFIYPLHAPEPALSQTPETAATPTSIEGSAQAVATAPAEARIERAARWSKAQLTAAAGVVLGIVALGLAMGLGLDNTSRDDQSRTIEVEAKRTPSVAVLPFINMSPDEENGHFADGLSEQLLNELANIPGLRIAGQTSSFYFKNKQEIPQTIARTLNVDHLLEGSVRRSGQRLRVTAQLIEAHSGLHLWSQTFDRDLTDAFQIQDEIARSVAQALKVELLSSDIVPSRTPPTNDAEAYRLYLVARGQISWLYGRPDWAVVKTSYEQAIARDSRFAAAHAGLAHYYCNRAGNDQDERLGAAAAERAVALDPDLSEALSARACWDIRRYVTVGDYAAYQRAVRDFRRAVEIDPANAQALFHFARAVHWNEPERALNLFERTLELDPLRFSAAGFAAGMMSTWRGQHETARQRTRELYERNPDKKFHNAIFVATLAMSLGELDEAVVYLRESIDKGERGSPLTLWGLYMSLGDHDAARLLLDTTDLGVMGEAAKLTMDDRYQDAFDFLEQRRRESADIHDFDVAVARLALIAGDPRHVVELLEKRLPSLAVGVEPINIRTVLPALDLAAARLRTGQRASGEALLAKAFEFFHGPPEPQSSQSLFLRARAHALSNQPELALDALERAYEKGFRLLWALDNAAWPFGYVDSIQVDPAFDALRSDPRYREWLSRTKNDNARQLAKLREHDRHELRLADTS